jgi:hypothetical protein
VRILDRNRAADLYLAYEENLRMLVAMINQPACWVIGSR